MHLRGVNMAFALALLTALLAVCAKGAAVRVVADVDAEGAQRLVHLLKDSARPPSPFAVHALQKWHPHAERAGAAALESLCAHPINADFEPHPGLDASRAGQLLWLLEEQLLLFRNSSWLRSVQPCVSRLTAFLLYLRRDPNAAVLVDPQTLAIPPATTATWVLSPRTPAQPALSWDVCGARAALTLSTALGAHAQSQTAVALSNLITTLVQEFNSTIGGTLLERSAPPLLVPWPCRVYALDEPPLRESLQDVHALLAPAVFDDVNLRRNPVRLDLVHQALLWGNRDSVRLRLCVCTRPRDPQFVRLLTRLFVAVTGLLHIRRAARRPHAVDAAAASGQRHGTAPALPAPARGLARRGL